MSQLQRRDGQEPLMVVYTTHNYAEAHIIAGKLDSEGIPVVVEREAAAGAIGLTLGSLGEVRVVVRERDFDRARSLIATDASDQSSLPDSVDRVNYLLDDDETHDDETYDDE